MIVQPSVLKHVFGISPSEVLHVGAGRFEEMQEYEKQGFSPVIWIDCHPATTEISRMKVIPPNEYIEACVGSANGLKRTLRIANGSSGSSSIFTRIGHDAEFPEIKYVSSIEVSTKRIDAILDSSNCPTFVNMDCEGSELDAIIGLGKLIDQIEVFYLEVSRPGWGDHANYMEIRRYLAKLGFKQLGIFWYWNKGFGDALFVKSTLNRPFKFKIRSLFFRYQYEFKRLKFRIVKMKVYLVEKLCWYS